MASQLPLQGVRVLEFEGLAPSVFAGLVRLSQFTPRILQLLADFGAEVIIVNRKEKSPISQDIHESTLNRNKKSIVLDLKREDDLITLKKLIAVSDVIIDSFRPG